jgi:uncharacterized membrane protein YjgN (DUF898 family)
MERSAALGKSAGRMGLVAHRVDTHAMGTGIEAYPLEFSGTGGEFFRVWIVNLLLTVVTLGFYTPFARRRTAQYFYSHTIVADSPLEFVAQQRKMVFGFLLLVGLYMAFKLAADTGQDTAASLLMLGGAALAPYFWGSAMRFRLNATRWRGVRLQFTAGWGEIYRASWPVFAIALAWIAMGLLTAVLVPEKAAGPGAGEPDLSAASWPAIAAGALVAIVVTVLCIIRLEFNFKSLLVAKARIGGQPGRWKPVYRDFVRIWMATLGVFLLCVAVVAGLIALAFAGSFAALVSVKKLGAFAVVIFAAMAVGSIFLLFLASGPARAYREARMFQLVWSNVGVSHIARFKCKLKAMPYVMLRVKNMFLTLLTLGFYRPFAMVSEYRMKTESVTLHVKGGLDQLAGQLAREEQGLGDAIADAVGLDLVG